MGNKEIAAFFNQYSEGFNAIYGTQNTCFNRIINKLFRKSIKARFEKTIQECQPIEGRTVIDVGCGPGHYVITLANMGAEYVYGIDFAENMTDLARRNAQNAGVGNKCRFATVDFLAENIQDRFDYAILMGFMDYIKDPEEVCKKAISITRNKAFFSFPKSNGVLALQRKIRYRWKCELFLYDSNELHSLFNKISGIKFKIEKLHRDYFVTVELDHSSPDK